MVLFHVQRHDLLEKLIQGHVGVGDDERPLLREVVVQVGNDLHSHISFAGSRRPDNQRQSWLHSCANGLHLKACEKRNVRGLMRRNLCWGKVHRVRLTLVAGIRPAINWRVGFNENRLVALALLKHQLVNKAIQSWNAHDTLL